MKNPFDFPEPEFSVIVFIYVTIVSNATVIIAFLPFLYYNYNLRSMNPSFYGIMGNET